MPIKVECPNCSKTIKAADKYAGQKAKCPGCGNVLRIPEMAPATAAVAADPLPDKPTEPPSPLREREIVREAGRGDTSKEQDVLTVRPSALRTRPVKYALICLLFAISSFASMFVKHPATGESMPVLWLFPLICLVVLGKWHLQEFTTSLKITNKRSILRHGILSKRTREVRHSDVRLLQLDQSITQRMFGVGTISIASAGHGEVEIRVSGIKKPEHVKETIDGYR